MAGIYDIHAHLNDAKYAGVDITSSEIVNEAKFAGVEMINNVGFDIKSSKTALIQAEKNKNVFAIIGIHPNEAHYFAEEAYIQLEDMAYSNKVVGIGEIGLDYSRTNKYKEQQIESFKRQIKIAEKLHLPILIHIKDVLGSEEAYNDVYSILQKYPKLVKVIHGYEGNLELAKKFIKIGCYISMDGRVTWDDEAQRVIEDISLNKMMVESSAPYGTPKPFENKINHPKYLPITIKKIAELKNTGVESVIDATRQNALDVFFVKK
ncbi:TatD family hydrolase [Mesoplasma photuris]|uniref:TatD family hydrolase n=1 Tax=Mesoplasma photuris TaxID=217731 RepID=UPI0004E27E5A|nr:TatD family hydrolase [Mesoplasma photuris]